MIRENNDKISPYQLFVIYVSAIIGVGSVSMPRELAEIGGTNGYLAIIAAGVIVWLISYAIYCINKKLDKNNFIDISKALVGNILTYIITVVFIMYCLIISGFEVKELTEIIKNFMYKSTPTAIISIGAIAISCYAISGGIETIARVFEILIVISFLTILAMAILILPQADFSNLLPVMHISKINFLKMIPRALAGFAGFELLLFLLPATTLKAKTNKYILSGLITVIAVFLFFNISVICKYGVEFTKILKWPGLNVIKDIYIKDSFIENPQMIIMATIIFGGLTTTIIYLYEAVNLTVLLFKPKKQHYIIILMAILTYAIYSIPANYSLEESFRNFIDNYCIPIVAILIPLILYGALIIKDRRDEQHAKEK